MDNKKDSAASDVPTFKVARVGEDRKRRGGAFSFLRGGGARGGWSGATGGAGAGIGAGSGGGAAALIGAGMNLSKMMLILLVSAGGIGAVGLGRMLGNMSGNDAVKTKPFSMASREPVKMEGDMSNLPGNANTIPNSLGYLSGSRDGLTPEERAKKEADAAAAAEAQRLADEAAAKAEADRLAAEPAVDPNALLASAQADGGAGGKGSAFGKKFGALSSSMGGGSSLSGGAGLSGGVNRQFGQSGSIAKGAAGRLSATKTAARPSYAKAGGQRLAASKTKGFARKQLANANAYSRKGAAASKGETSASDAGTAFDNNPGAGNVISGPGIGQGSGASGGADTSPNSINNGGPTGGGSTGPVDCGANNYQTADGGCAPIQTTAGKDAKPMLTMMANVAMGLMLLVGILSMMSTAALGVPIVGTAFSFALTKIIGVLGIMITLLGVAMMAMGDYVTGGIATLIGGITTALAWPALAGGLTAGQGMVLGFGGAALSMVGKMLDKGNHKDKAPVAAQQ